MTNDDLRHLIDRGPDRPLDHLEADVWERFDKLERARRTSRVISACQITVMTLALIGSAVIGATKVSFAPQQSDIASVGNALTPSTLLLGKGS